MTRNSSSQYVLYLFLQEPSTAGKPGGLDPPGVNGSRKKRMKVYVNYYDESRRFMTYLE